MTRLYSVEVKIGTRWFFVEARSSLRDARKLRDRLYPESTTRIRKWVRP